MESTLFIVEKKILKKIPEQVLSGILNCKLKLIYVKFCFCNVINL